MNDLFMIALPGNRDRNNILAYFRHPKEITGLMDEENWWKKERGTDAKIIKTRQGSLIYQKGIVLNLKEDSYDSFANNFFEQLRVTPDFSVHINLESLSIFKEERERIPKNKRGELYGMKKPCEFLNLGYLFPYDIMTGILKANLSGLFKKREKLIKIFSSAGGSN